MARYTARHVYHPSKGKRLAYEYDQPKSQHDKPSAVRRLTALPAAAAALIGGGYLGHQHYHHGEKTLVAVAHPTSGELAEYAESPFVTDPATGETHCRDTTRQEISVTAEKPQTTITNPDGSTTRLTMITFSTSAQERTQATLVYPSSAEGEPQQVPIAIATGPSKTGKGGWNMTTSPHIGRTGAKTQASTTAAGPGAHAIACAPPPTSSQSK
ncbi:hypothetical protein HG437_000690 [Candidatus Saccharibacteria bacterium]|nr:hypothetical protein [Candidatus Saccharibacteria bacterium]